MEQELDIFSVVNFDQGNNLKASLQRIRAALHDIISHTIVPPDVYDSVTSVLTLFGPRRLPLTRQIKKLDMDQEESIV